MKRSRLVWGVYVAEREGEEPLDGSAVAAGGETLDALAALLPGPFFGGNRPSLADLWALPMLTYLRQALTGREILSARPPLTGWLDHMRSRQAVRRTRFPNEEE